MFLLLIIITQVTSQNIRSLYLSQFNDMKYQCNNFDCSSSIIVPISTVEDCQFVCLSNIQCRTITFDPSMKQCQIFSDIPGEFGDLISQIGVVTMTAIDERRLSAPTRTSTTTSTTSTTSTSSTTTRSPNPCATDNLRWNTTGITVLTATPLLASSGVYVDANDTLYAVDEDSNFVVWKLLKNAVNATIIAGLKGSQGSSSSQLNYPNDIYIDRNGNLYVSDSYNHRIQKFVNGSQNGITIAGITASAGPSLSQFSVPRYMTFSANETYLYVADCNNHRVLRYWTNSTSGVNGVLVAGGNGANNVNTSLYYPWGIDNQPSISDDIFITNFNGHSVMRWTPGASSGTFVAGTPGVAGSSSTLLNGPIGIKIDRYLNMYVVDFYNNKIQMFCNNNRTGITIAGTGAAGSSATQLNAPRGIAFDSAMNLYVGDSSNKRVQKFLKL